MDKIYIINLNRDKKKKEHIEALCKKYDWAPIFIDAVDGRLLDENEVSRFYQKDASIQELGRELSRSELGCALSHIKIYKKMVDQKIGRALIVEDDIDFGSDLKFIFSLVENLSNSWEIILMGHHSGASREIYTEASVWGGKRLSKKYKLLRPCENAYGTYGYMLTLKAAEKLLDFLTKIVKPIDHYTGDSKLTNLFIINPPPITINRYLSDNFHSMDHRNDLRIFIVNSKIDERRRIEKKFLLAMRLYSILIVVKKKIKRLINKIKPVRTYK